MEKVLETVHIAANKNTVPGDVSAMVPGGIRMGKYVAVEYLLLIYFKIKFGKFLISALHHAGTPALTSRGFVEEDFAKVADFFDAAVNLAVKVKAATTGHSKSFFLKKVFAFIEVSASLVG